MLCLSSHTEVLNRFDLQILSHLLHSFIFDVHLLSFNHNQTIALCSVASVVSDSLQPYGLQPSRLLCPCDSPGKNIGVGSHALLQGNLSNPRIEPASLMSPVLAGGFFTTSINCQVQIRTCLKIKIIQKLVWENKIIT